jgi:HEAT repeat protein
MGEKVAGDSAAGRGFTVRMLIVLVACCGAIFWAARAVWDSVPVNGRVRALRTGEPGDRRSAAQLLWESKQGEVGAAVPALVDALGGDADDGVRVMAARSLGATGLTALTAPDGPALTRQAVAGLVRALKDRQAEVRAEAAQSLGVIAAALPNGPGPPFDPAAAAGALAEAMRDPSAPVRDAAQKALAQLAARAAVDPPPAVIAALSEDGSADVRASAASFLGGFIKNPKGVVGPLVRALKDGDPRVRYEAANALGRLGPGAREAVPALLAALKEPAGDFPAAPPDTTNHSRPWRRDPACAAAVALGWVAKEDGPAAEVVTALAETLKSGDGARRAAAAHGLAQLKAAARPAVPALTAALSDSLGAADEPGVGPAAVQALDWSAPWTPPLDGEVVAALTRAVDARNRETRHFAITTLGHSGQGAAAALPRLRALRDRPGPNDQAMPAAAAEAIKQIESAPDPPAR